ncbi:MAG: lysophospholipid acyltransferase family protein [Vicinamibacterales bacterium]
MRHRLEYFAVVVMTVLVRLLPWGAVRGLGNALGFAFYAVDGTHRRITRSNLVRAFPLRSERECRALCRSVFLHFGRLALELLKFSTLTQDEMLSLVEFEGDDRARQAYSSGHGVIFLTGHFGFWELNGIVHALKVAPIGVLARALDNPYLNAMLERLRQSTGNSVIYRKGAARRIMRALSANQGVAMLIDQHVHGSDRVFVDFFDRPAATTPSVAVLARRTGAVVIPVFAIPTADGRYRMVYEPPVPPPADDSPEAIRDFTQRCTDVLEMYVRRYPHLWLWMHRRWRDENAADALPGMFPSARGDRGASLQNGEEPQET